MAPGVHSMVALRPNLPRASRMRVWSWGSLIWLVVAAVMVILIVDPLVRLVGISFHEAGPGGAWTLANYGAAFNKVRYIVGFRNSLLLGLSVACVCVVLGVPLAWAVSRTDMPCKGLVRTLVLATFVTPPFLGAMSWILLASPRAGWLNAAFMAIFHTGHGFLDIYTFPGIVFVLAIYSFPYIFVFTVAALDLISSEMEEAANILGAGRIRTTLRVTLPLALPAILAGFALTFLEAISIISSTIMVAIPARINLIPLQLWAFFSYPLRVEVAAAYSMPLLMIAVSMYWFQKLALGRKGYTVLTGKGGQRRPTELGPFRWLMLGYCMFVLVLSVILPYLVLGLGAFSHSWTRGLSISNFSLENFAFLFSSYNLAPQSIVNTFVYSAVTATVGVLLAFCVAYTVNRKLVPFGGVLGALALTPLVIPGIVLAIGFYAAYAPPPLSLAGTATILVLAFITRFLPIAYASIASAIGGLNVELEEAARILGGGRFFVLCKVLTPILKQNLAGAWLLVFILTTREVSSALFLYGPRTRTMSVLFFDLAENGRFEVLCALGVILLGTALAFVFLGQMVVGRDFMVQRSSS
ncbi:MAG: ABC transporter permease [Acetobacteraceae bacterium]